MERRVSASARGYDYRWRVWAAEFRRRHPVCARCPDLTQVVDHKETREVMYLRHGGETYKDEDYQGLCHRCNLRKARDEDPLIRVANGLPPQPANQGVGG